MWFFSNHLFPRGCFLHGYAMLSSTLVATKWIDTVMNISYKILSIDIFCTRIWRYKILKLRDVVNSSSYPHYVYILLSVINTICFGEYNFVQRWKTKMFVANQKQTKENIHLQFSPSERTTLTILIKLIFHHNQVKTIIKKYFSNPTLTVKKTFAYNILSLTAWMRKNVMYGHIQNLMLNAFRRTHFETAAQLTVIVLKYMHITDYGPFGNFIICLSFSSHPKR